MKLGIILLALGSIFAFYLTNIKLKKKFLTKLGIAFGILVALYGLILLVQPDDYIKFTKTTISSKS